jgi:hypothetical protein
VLAALFAVVRLVWLRAGLSRIESGRLVAAAMMTPGARTGLQGLAVAGRPGVLPAVEVGRLDAELGRRQPDLQGRSTSASCTSPSAISTSWSAARRAASISASKPGAGAAELALVLPAHRAQHGRPVAAHDVQERHPHRP